jgi:phosphoglucomutase
MLNTAVSSNMIQRLEGFNKEETLTGFKWLGNKAHELRESGNFVPFAYEEALGYMFPDISYDKDGLAAAAVFLLALAKWKLEGLTPYTKLQQLYEKYGYFETLNIPFPSDAKNTEKTFELIRAFFKDWTQNAPEQVMLGQFSVDRIRDLTVGRDWRKNTLDGVHVRKPTLPITEDVQMITFWLSRLLAMEEIRFTLRGSGTEPKVKREFLPSS